jgi:hypothetical protein
VFDKKRKRQGKEEEKKRLIKKQISPHLFLISSQYSPSSPSFIIGKKRIFEQP